MQRFLYGFILLVLSFMAFSLAFVDEAAKMSPLQDALVFKRVTCCLFGCMFLAAWYKSWRRRELRANPRRYDYDTMASQPDGVEIRAAARAIARRYGATSASLDPPAPIVALMEMLLDLSAFVLRATEEVRVVGDELSTEVCLEIDTQRYQDLLASEASGGQGIPGPRRPEGARRNGRSQRRLVPILNRKLVRGDVETLTASGERATASVLTPPQTQGMLYLILCALLGWGIKPGTEPEAYRGLAEELLQLVCRLDAVDKREFDEAYRRAIGGVEFRNPAKLRAIFQLLATNYISIVDMKGDNGDSVVRYRTTLPPSGTYRTGNDRMRALVGLRPFRIFIPLIWPFYAQSYQLNIFVPEGQFIFQHYLRDEETQKALDPTGSKSTKVRGVPRYILKNNMASSRTSVYVSDFHRADPKEITCVVDFEEIPPGALGAAAVISAACTALTLAYAIALPPDRATVGVDLGALLLASPLFVANLVGQSSERVKNSSLTTHGGLAVAILTSLGSILLYIIQAHSKELVYAWRLSILECFQLPAFDPCWMGLGLMSAGVTTYLAIQSRYRMSRYTGILGLREATEVGHDAGMVPGRRRRRFTRS